MYRFAAFALILAACSSTPSELTGDSRYLPAGDSHHDAGDTVQNGDTNTAGDMHAPGDTVTPGDTFVPAGDTDGPLPPAAAITGLAVPYDIAGRAADAGDGWVDIILHDTSQLGSNWRLMSGTFEYVTEQLHASNIPWALADGDRLRFHGVDYTGGDDVSKEDNNDDRWDLTSTSIFPVNIRHGIVWIEDGAGNIVDLVAYETGRNDIDWLTGEPLGRLQDSVASGQWSSDAIEDAVFIEDADTTFARVQNESHDANAATAWEIAGAPNPDYYFDARGLTGTELKRALNFIIKGHTVIAYADLTSVFRITDRDPANTDNVIQFYTGHSTANDFNREHVWAKSHGGFDADSQDGYSDLHHMRPTRPDVNSARWHLDFAEGGDLYSDSSCRRVIDLSWEPRDAVKGDVARTLFYMAVRYEGDDSNMPDLELVETIPSLLNALGEPDNYQHSSTPRMGKLSTMLDWHIADPPDAEEERRNEAVFTDFQHNRNPFIDYPEWVAEIWGGPVWPH